MAPPLPLDDDELPVGVVSVPPPQAARRRRGARAKVRGLTAAG
jgi:hypothetical protein